MCCKYTKLHSAAGYHALIFIALHSESSADLNDYIPMLSILYFFLIVHGYYCVLQANVNLRTNTLNVSIIVTSLTS
jgi:hypothetical protein